MALVASVRTLVVFNALTFRFYEVLQMLEALVEVRFQLCEPIAQKVAEGDLAKHYRKNEYPHHLFSSYSANANAELSRKMFAWRS